MNTQIQGTSRFDVSKSTCAIGLKLRWFLFRFHPWWLLVTRRSTWADWGNFQGRWVKHSFRWRKRWKVEVSFQTFCGSAVGQVFFGCHCHFRLSLLQRSLHFKEKEDQTKGGHGHPEVGNEPIRSYQLQKCCDLLNEWKYINAYLDTFGKNMEMYSNHHQIIIRIDSWGYKNGFIAGIHVEHDLWVIRRNKENEAKVRSNSCYSYCYSSLGIMIPKLFCLSLI